MKKVLVAGRLHAFGHEILDAAKDLEVHYIDEVSEESYAPFVDTADALLLRTQPMTATTIARAARLKIVSRHGVGYEAVDIGALSKRGIALSICGDVNSYSVAEHAVMLILATAKAAVQADRAVRQGDWAWRSNLVSQDLRGKRVLQVGYGRIGRHIASMLAGFGVEIRAHDPWLRRSGWPEGPVLPVDRLEDGLEWADVVSLSVPGTDRPLLDARELARMTRGGVVVNTGRGGAVDEQALADALRAGHLSAAGLDVFAQEPPARDNPLFGLDRVILSPHIAGVTEGAAERMAVGAAQNIVDFFAGTLDPDLVVNRDAVSPP